MGKFLHKLRRSKSKRNSSSPNSSTDHTFSTSSEHEDHSSTSTAPPPLRLDCTTLMNHLSIVQRSLGVNANSDHNVPDDERDGTAGGGGGSMKGMDTDPSKELSLLRLPFSCEDASMSSSPLFSGGSGYSSNTRRNSGRYYDSTTTDEASSSAANQHRANTSSSSRREEKKERKKDDRSASKREEKKERKKDDRSSVRIRRRRKAKKEKEGGGISSIMREEETAVDEDWYVLVANTPYNVSAQLVSVPSRPPPGRVCSPDVSRCTPISIWTAGAGGDNAAETKDGGAEGGDAAAGDSEMECINCRPSILLLEPSAGHMAQDTEYIKVAVLLGTNKSRLLSVQLSIHAHSPQNTPNIEPHSGIATSPSHNTDQYSSAGGGNSSPNTSSSALQRSHRPFKVSSRSTSSGSNTDRHHHHHQHYHHHHHPPHHNTGRVRYIMQKAMGVQILQPLPLEKEQDIYPKGSFPNNSNHGSTTNSTTPNPHNLHTTSSRNSDNTSQASSTTAGRTSHHSQFHNRPRSATGITSSGGHDDSMDSTMNTNTMANALAGREVDDDKIVPFCPEGGVRTIHSYYNHQGLKNKMNQTHLHNPGTNTDGSRMGYKKKQGGALVDGIDNFVWIGYGDGSIVRLPHWAFFPLDLEDIELGTFISHGYQNLVVNARVVVRGAVAGGGDAVRRSGSDKGGGSHTNSAGGGSDHNNSRCVLPLPGSFPSLLSQPLASSTLTNTHQAALQSEDASNEYPEDEDYHVVHQHEFCEAITYDGPHHANTSNSTATPETSEPFSSLTFFTDEDQRYSQTHVHTDHGSKLEVDQRLEAIHTLIKGGSTLITETATIAKSALTTAVSSVFYRGVGGGTANHQQHPPPTIVEQVPTGIEVYEGQSSSSVLVPNHHEDPAILANSFFPQLHAEPAGVMLGGVSFDAPRKVIDATIEPRDGRLLACADNLGRVQLIDLETKQVVRMWKGFRDATCHWIQEMHWIGGGGGGGDCGHGGGRCLTYLVIYARQRNVIEIFRMRHGPRVAKIEVESSNAQIVQCIVTSKDGWDSYTKCFLIETSPTTHKVIATELVPNDEDLLQLANPDSHHHATPAEETPAGPSTLGYKLLSDKLQSKDTMQLQLLRQQLGSQTLVPSDLDSIYFALGEITALSDLSKALDLLAVVTHMENGVDVEDSSFHLEVVTYVKNEFETISKDDLIATSNNVHLKTLKDKIHLHSQLITAYDVLNKFEKASYNEDEGHHQDNDDDDDASNPKSIWANEALAWIKTHESVTNRGLDRDLIKQPQHPLLFSIFAKASLQQQLQHNQDHSQPSSSLTTLTTTDNKRKLFLCDSTRDRKLILMHLFKPLLKDVFVFKTTHNIFQEMAIDDQHDTLLQYFGEWFMSLPAMTAAKSSLYLWAPTVRWLQDIIHDKIKTDQLHQEELQKQKQKQQQQQQSLGEDETSMDGEGSTAGTGLYLETLYNFCVEATDLPRAFLLAVLCYESISAAATVLEEKSYGLVSREECVKPWTELIRKIRMCLLVSLRLHSPSYADPNPITVSNIDNGQTFSIYEWIARDELSISHKHGEISSLEEACWASTIGFNPAHVDGDDLHRWKMVQLSCTMHSGASGGGGGASGALGSGGIVMKGNLCPTDYTKPGPLLLFMQHYNNQTKLSAHRFVILANMWGREPKSLHLLKDAVSALRSLDMEGDIYGNLLVAVVDEVWQTQLRPVYRAILFGFDDVPEISEDTISPLCMDIGWLQSLIKISITIIDFLDRTVGDEQFNPDEGIPNDQGYSDCTHGWPPLQEDILIQNYFTRIRSIAKSSIEIHRAMLLALQLSDDDEDLELLSMCVPSFDMLFLKHSFYEDFYVAIEPNEYQEEFIHTALRRHAVSVKGPTVHRDDIEGIVSLGSFWGLNKGEILTQFVLFMYEVGKDDVVEDMVNVTKRILDMPAFIAGGIMLSCVRLNATVMILKKVKHHRSFLAMLDADTCQWVKEEAEKAIAEKPELRDIGSHGKLPPIEKTNALILQMMRMTVLNQSQTRALSTMSGTLLEALTQFDDGLGLIRL